MKSQGEGGLSWRCTSIMINNARSTASYTVNNIPQQANCTIRSGMKVSCLFCARTGTGELVSKSEKWRILYKGFNITYMCMYKIVYTRLNIHTCTCSYMYVARTVYVHVMGYMMCVAWLFVQYTCVRTSDVTPTTRMSVCLWLQATHENMLTQYFSACNEKEMREWIDALQLAANVQTDPQPKYGHKYLQAALHKLHVHVHVY